MFCINYLVDWVHVKTVQICETGSVSFNLQKKTQTFLQVLNSKLFTIVNVLNTAFKLIHVIHPWWIHFQSRICSIIFTNGKSAFLKKHTSLCCRFECLTPLYLLYYKTRARSLSAQATSRHQNTRSNERLFFMVLYCCDTKKNCWTIHNVCYLYTKKLSRDP